MATTLVRRLPWLAEPRYLAWSSAAGIAGLVAFGLVSAIIPNPVFGRQIPPEPFAIVVWLVSGLLMGLLAGTYLVPPPATAVTLPAPAPAVSPGTAGATGTAAGTATYPGPAGSAAYPAAAADVAVAAGDGGGPTSALGYAGGLAAFLAIGCPVCNKVALVLLGTSGALTIWAPLQPLVGIVSLALLGATLAWRLRMRARGNACPVA
jgi:hypothetical protein